MQELQNLEALQIEVLNLLNSIKVLDYFYFGGGTMLRLCHNLNRYSTDMDFWLDSNADPKSLYTKCKKSLSDNYSLTDSANKKFSLLFEIKAPEVNRRLKIEIRKSQSDFKWERKIAFSNFSNIQVMVKGLTLPQMMVNKINSIISRKIIRDAFDLEFLLMRGIELPPDKDKLTRVMEIINGFKQKDFKVTLGSILDSKDRTLYIENQFGFLKEEIISNINKLN